MRESIEKLNAEIAAISGHPFALHFRPGLKALDAVLTDLNSAVVCVATAMLAAYSVGEFDLPKESIEFLQQVVAESEDGDAVTKG